MARCEAKTKSGNRCKNDAVSINGYCHLKAHQAQSPEAGLTDKQRRFVEEYCVDYNSAAAARRAGYSEKTSGEQGYQLLQKTSISSAIKRRMSELAMTTEEAVKRMADWGRGTAHPFLSVDKKTKELRIDLSSEEAQKNLHLIKKIKQNDTIIKKANQNDPDEVIGRSWEIELHDQKDAVDKILKVLGAYSPERFEDVTPQPKSLVMVVSEKDHRKINKGESES